MSIADPPLQEELDRLSEEDEAFVERHDDGSLTLSLDVPLQIYKGKNREPEERTELKLRKARARDWMETDKAKGEISKTAHLLAALADVPFKVIEDMDGEDFMRACRLAGSLGNPQRTGGKLSGS